MKLILSVILTFFCLASAAEKIEYEIYDLSSGELIGSGVREYGKSDVLLKPYTSGGKKIVEKHIELEKGFKVGARIFSEQRLTGFGLVAELTPQDFSWEWYNQVTGRTFKKLQGEKGLVKIRVSGLPVLERLEEVEFLDNATLGFKLGGAGNSESHEIIIKKGSVLKFD